MSRELKIGMVGLDTSHCEVFAKTLHNTNTPTHLPGGRIVAVYPGGSRQFSKSHERVAGYTELLTKTYGARLYDDLGALARDVDAIMLESVDGRQHREQFAQLAVGKPVFVDKPFACSVSDAREMIAIAQASRTPVMSCSSIRYAVGIADLVSSDDSVVACETFGPAALLEDYPGLFWYGIHTVDMLYARMGAGCTQVRLTERPGMDVLVGDWPDGRVGVVRGMRAGSYDFGAVVHTEKATRCGLSGSTPTPYYLMLQQVLPFLRSGKAPIDLAETFGSIAFIEAAEQSRAQGGNPVTLAML